MDPSGAPGATAGGEAVWSRFIAYVPDVPETTPAFFFHIGKTGGTTLTGVLAAIAWHRRRPLVAIPARVGSREEPMPEAMRRVPDPIAFAGHCAFGFHRAFDRPLHLCTLLREPAARTVSEYFWRTQRAGRMAAVLPEDFAWYLDNLAENNAMTRRLSGLPVASWRSVETALGHLDRFFAVGAMERFAEIATALLSVYGVPSLRIARAKAQHDPRIPDFLDRFRDLILERNRLDEELYARAAPLFDRVPALYSGLTTASPDTVAATLIGGKTFEFSAVSA